MDGGAGTLGAIASAIVRGEWEVVPPGDERGHWVVQHRGVVLALCGTGEEGRRTAQLIAAAPRLLALAPRMLIAAAFQRTAHLRATGCELATPAVEAELAALLRELSK